LTIGGGLLSLLIKEGLRKKEKEEEILFTNSYLLIPPAREEKRGGGSGGKEGQVNTKFPLSIPNDGERKREKKEEFTGGTPPFKALKEGKAPRGKGEESSF